MWETNINIRCLNRPGQGIWQNFLLNLAEILASTIRMD